MLEKVITKCPKRLFHLSEENHDGEYFKPRVPDSIIDSGEYNKPKVHFKYLEKYH